MKSLLKYSVIVVATLLVSCDRFSSPIVEPDADSGEMYFPPKDGSTWENITPASLNWPDDKIEKLYDFLAENNTRGFIVLKNGKIVLEKYWGKTILQNSNFDKNSQWYWASAGKSLTAFLVGKAQEEGYLKISDKTSQYLGKGWTTAGEAKEDLISIKHQLTMTSGIDYAAADANCLEPQCLKYKTDAGQQWYYHNAVYTLLESVVTKAVGKDYTTYTRNTLGNTIGVNGQWLFSNNINLFWSTPRDMARFGLLMLNNGDWAGESIMSDKTYIKSMLNTSQNINQSYGYLWWLNGKGSIVYPGSTAKVNLDLSPNAPADLVAGMGKNGQFVEVIPSLNMVVVRMGDAPDGSEVSVKFHDEMWGKIRDIVGY